MTTVASHLFVVPLLALPVVDGIYSGPSPAPLSLSFAVSFHALYAAMPLCRYAAMPSFYAAIPLCPEITKMMHRFPMDRNRPTDIRIRSKIYDYHPRPNRRPKISFYSPKQNRLAKSLSFSFSQTNR